MADSWEIAGCWWFYIIWMLCTGWRDRTETIEACIDAHEWKTCLSTAESLRDNDAPVLLYPVQASILWTAFWGVAEVVFCDITISLPFPLIVWVLNLHKWSTFYFIFMFRLVYSALATDAYIFFWLHNNCMLITNQEVLILPSILMFNLTYFYCMVFISSCHIFYAVFLWKNGLNGSLMELAC